MEIGDRGGGGESKSKKRENKKRGFDHKGTRERDWVLVTREDRKASIRWFWRVNDYFKRK